MSLPLGTTHWRLRPDVLKVAATIARQFPVTWNTYEGHPWSGWDHRSVDFWGPGGRGDPIPLEVGREVLQALRGMPGLPHIRHHIYLNRLWTSWGGYSWWPSEDHSGRLRHVHVTYW